MRVPGPRIGPLAARSAGDAAAARSAGAAAAARSARDAAAAEVGGAPGPPGI